VGALHEGHDMMPRRGEKNAGLVLSCLEAAARPLKAYEILEALRPQGINAAMTVYRALARLQAVGMVHRIDSLNAFLAVPFVPDPLTHGERAMGVAICDQCGAVAPFWDDALAATMAREVKNFAVRTLSLELHGLCGVCRAPPS
jgi:Fur family transcriptional regulator, zinc uptake regulator